MVDPTLVRPKRKLLLPGHPLFSNGELFYLAQVHFMGVPHFRGGPLGAPPHESVAFTYRGQAADFGPGCGELEKGVLSLQLRLGVLLEITPHKMPSTM